MSDQEQPPKKNKGGFQKGFDPRRSLGGRPERTCDGIAIPEYARTFGTEMLEVLVGIARDPKAKPADRSKAAERVLSRGFGSAPQTIQINAEVQHEHHTTAALDLSALSIDLKRELLGVLMRQDAIEGEVLTALPSANSDDA